MNLATYFIAAFIRFRNNERMGFEKIKIPEDNSVADAMKSFRGAAGDQTTESWLVLGYQQGSKNAICVLGQGEGSVQEARAMFPEKDAAYALFRKAHKVEMARTVKFAALFWMPERASPMRKALLSTHKGQMEDLLKPYHVNVICDCQKELDEAEADIMDKIGFSSGTKSQVTNKKAWSAVGGNIAAGATNEMTGTVGAGERANSSTGYQVRRSLCLTFYACLCFGFLTSCCGCVFVSAGWGQARLGTQVDAAVARAQARRRGGHQGGAKGGPQRQR